MGAFLDITNVAMRFPGSHVPVLEHVSLLVQRGQYVSIIGHSGCGKSTLLNIVAGLLRSTDGGVVLDGREVDEPGPDRAVVFQNHSLLPWLTCRENVGLAVDQVFGRKEEQAERARLGGGEPRAGAHDARRRQAAGRDQRWDEAARSASRGRWRCSRRCCCWTSRSARSMRSRGRICRTR